MAVSLADLDASLESIQSFKFSRRIYPQPFYAPCCQVVFGFLGSIISTLKIYVFPALMLLAWARQLDRGGAGGASGGDDTQALLLKPVFQTGGTSAADHTAVTAPLASGDDLDDSGHALKPVAESSRLVSTPHLHRGMPEFLPRSPLWLRVHAVLLLTLATTIAVIGTAATAAKAANVTLH